jgi:L-alanine-DL-glutamate epimerase-like enolase superfamily enzyme
LFAERAVHTFIWDTAPAHPRMRTVKPTDIRIEDVSYNYEDFLFRTPIKFGGVALDRCTLINVECAVRTRSGRAARGFGSMPLGNVWSFPSRALGYDGTLGAMKALAERVRAITAGCTEVGHPLDITHALEPEYHKSAAEVTRELRLVEPVPHLCTLVVASPFDAALHDAFGKAHGLNCYHTYGPDFLSHDLGHYLGREFQGERLDRYLARDPQERMPLYHLVGALDPLTPAEVRQPVGDGLPETLGEWIGRDGLTHIKIKLNGEDLGWDVERVVGVEAVAEEAQRRRGVERWCYSLDFNERCANVGYLLEFLRRLKERRPAAFERIAYIEQPTARDLKADRANVMHEAAKLRPVVIDESLLDLESLQLAREMGYTGAALKACKGQTQSLLLAAAARKYGLFLCVQDLTCPGASLIHSAGLAAHVPGVSAIESNARQYAPAANAPWAERFPGIFRITDGTMHTGELTGVGLGAVP